MGEYRALAYCKSGTTYSTPMNLMRGGAVTLTVPTTTVPRVETYLPADDATGVPRNASLVLTFSEAVRKGSGNIVIDASGTANDVTIPVTSTAVDVSGRTVRIFTVREGVVRLAANTAYSVRIASGAIEDREGNAYAGITDGTTWNFTTGTATDTTAPTVSGYLPADDATGVALYPQLKLTFDEPVAKGPAGRIWILYDRESPQNIGGGRSIRMDVNSPLVSVGRGSDGINVVTIDLTDRTDPRRRVLNRLDGWSEYYVQITEGAFVDRAGNRYAGIADKTTWGFITGANETSGTGGEGDEEQAAEVSLGVEPATVTEGSPVTVTATLSSVLGEDVSIPVTLAAGATDPAEPADHGTLASIAITAGETSGSVSVATHLDADGDDETFTVALDTDSLPSSVTAGSPASVSVTIDDTVTGETVAAVLFPNPPAIVEAAAGDGQVTLTWSSVADATGWEVERDGGGTWTDTGSAERSYTVTGLDNGTAYSFKVRATKLGVLTGDASASASATPVANRAPTGKPSISGTAQVDETLTADISRIGDADGLTRSGWTYQWVRVAQGEEGTDIEGATEATYVVVAADRDGKLKVKVDFTDDGGNAETLTSDATATVLAASGQVSAAPGFVDCASGAAAGEALDLRHVGGTRAGYVCYGPHGTELDFALGGFNGDGSVPHRSRDAALFAFGAEESHTAGEVQVYRRSVSFKEAPAAIGTDGDDQDWFDAKVEGADSARAVVLVRVHRWQTPAFHDCESGAAAGEALDLRHGGGTLAGHVCYGPHGAEIDFALGGFNEDGSAPYRSQDAALFAFGAEESHTAGEVQVYRRSVSFRAAPAALGADGDSQDWFDAKVEGMASARDVVLVKVHRSANPGLSVADANVAEPGTGQTATLDFAVTLARAGPGTVTVDYATGKAGDTATAGSDYTATSGTLTFAAGETQKTVAVAVLADSHDDGGETLTLTLSNPLGASISDAEATGTITNDGPIPKAWIARFGRTVAEQVVEAVEGRMQAPRNTGTEVSLAGERLEWGAGGDGEDAGFAQAAALREAEARQEAARLGRWLEGATGAADTEGLEARTVTERELLLGSSFSLTSETAGGGSAAFWGRGAVTRFDGREGETSLDGEVTTAMLGADWSLGRTTAGLILGHSLGDGGYRGASGGGTVSSTLTGLYPWGRYALSERVSVWGVAGWGEGTLSVTPENADGAGQAVLRADLDLAMGAAGLRGTLLDGGADGFTLAAKTDALGVRTSSGRGRGADGGTLSASEATVTRLRLGLEASRPLSLSPAGATLTPSLEVGVRRDGGDAETGFGVDLGGGLALSDPGLGLEAELRARGLLTHEADGFRERGLSGALNWRQRPDSDRGATLSLTQTVGGAASGGADALLSRATLDGLAANDGGGGGDDLAARRLEARLGYGLPAFGGRFTLTPEAGAGFSDTGRDQRLSVRLTPAAGAESFELILEAARHEADDDPAAERVHDFRLGLTVRF